MTKKIIEINNCNENICKICGCEITADWIGIVGCTNQGCIDHHSNIF